MNQNEIKHVQERIGTTVDGYWGELSTRAAIIHLTALTPPNRFPTQSKVREGDSIFGQHGTEDGFTPPMTSIRLPFALHLYGESHNILEKISCNTACATALEAVFHRLAEQFPNTGTRKKAGVLDYYGIYNPRFSRNARVWSMHSYAIAIDLDANRNNNRSHWPTRSKMSIEIMECFAQEGFLSAGAFWSRDAMHFQATSSSV